MGTKNGKYEGVGMETETRMNDEASTVAFNESLQVLRSSVLYMQRIAHEHGAMPQQMLEGAPDEKIDELRDTLALGHSLPSGASEAVTFALLARELDSFQRPIIPSSVWPVLRKSDRSERLRSLAVLFQRVLSSRELSVLQAVCIPFGTLCERYGSYAQVVDVLAPRLLGTSLAASSVAAGEASARSVVQLILEERYTLLGTADNSQLAETQPYGRQKARDTSARKRMQQRHATPPVSINGHQTLSTVTEQQEQTADINEILDERLQQNVIRFVRKCGHLYEEHRTRWEEGWRYESKDGAGKQQRSTINNRCLQLSLPCSLKRPLRRGENHISDGHLQHLHAS